MNNLDPNAAARVARRMLTLVLTGALAFALVAVGSIVSTTPVSAATTIAPTTTCSNNIDNTPGLGLICEVTVENTYAAGG